MRKLTPLVLGCLLTLAGGAQSSKDTLQNECYLFDHFINGTVWLSSGQTQQVPLNYNAKNGTIAFEQNGEYMTVTNPGDVDSVHIGDHRFLPVRDHFYELALSSQPFSLLIAYDCKPHPRTAVVDHNGTSRQDNDRVSNVVSEVYLNRRYKGDFVMVFQPKYWFLHQNRYLYKANNEKQVIKVFPKKADAISDFIRTNNIDFQKPEDVVKLARFCNS